MGSCINISTCMKDTFTTYEDQSEYSVSPFPENDNYSVGLLDLNLQENKNYVKNNPNTEIKEFSLYKRPMIRRSLTSILETLDSATHTPKNSIIPRKFSRANSIVSNSSKKITFLAKAKEKLRKLSSKEFSFDSKENNLSQESTDGFNYVLNLDKISVYLGRLKGDKDSEPN